MAGRIWKSVRKWHSGPGVSYNTAMGKLEELEEGLYGAEDRAISARMKRRVIFSSPDAEARTSWANEAKKPPREKPKGRVRQLSFYLAGVGLLFAAGAIIFILLYLQVPASEAEVVIQGRDFVAAGESLTVSISIRNTSKVKLQEVNLVVMLPGGSLVREEDGIDRPSPARIVKKVDDLGPGEEKSIEVATRMFGREGDEVSIDAELSYKPENLRARFSARGNKRIMIASVPLTFFWEAPDKLSLAQEVTLRAHIRSQARVALENLWARIEYPPVFTVISSDPKSDADDGFWKIGTLEPDQEVVVTIQGKITGAGGGVSAFRGGVGVYNALTKEWKPWREATKEFTITAAPLFLETVLRSNSKQSIIPGEQLDVMLRYRNNSGVTLKNVSVRSFLEGDIIDQATLRVGEGGVFDFGARAIVWGPGGTAALQNLAPGEEGELSFSAATRARPAVRIATDKNLMVRVRSQISVADPPQGFEGTQVGMDNILELKVQSVVLFSGRALFRSSPIPTSGPLPPKVGEKTVYTLVWEIRNFTNDLENVEVRASLPPNIKWENVVSPRDAGITYDASSGEVRWRIGKIDAGIGILNPALTGAFQVSVTPSLPDAAKFLVLLGESRFSLRDRFTGEERTKSVSSFSTELREDPLTTSDDWSVAR